MAEAFMSLFELELFEHAAHLDGERPDGMRRGGGWKKESATEFSLNLPSFQNKFWHAAGLNFARVVTDLHKNEK